MNCKNCGAPVDGHIACPKCGQLVDFTGSISNTPVRTSYGISWGAEEETPAAKPISEPVEDTKVESVVEQPVVEVQAKADETKPEVETSVKPEPTKPGVETSVKPEPTKPAPVIAELKTDTSEDESEELSIFDTLGEAMDNIAEEVLDVSDDIKEDIADVVDMAPLLFLHHRPPLDMLKQ